ncbi:MAG TPA: ferredoxin [Gemmatimonadales bacterium]|nr:ferredoxin [Gemmatimonadales bacterium]
MAFEERTVHGLKIRIDRELCVGFADCVGEAPEAFKLDAEGVVTFVAPELVEPERLVRASDLCPVDAITVWDERGNQLAPSPG